VGTGAADNSLQGNNDLITGFYNFSRQTQAGLKILIYEKYEKEKLRMKFRSGAWFMLSLCPAVDSQL
jgi:hypothetical protein